MEEYTTQQLQQLLDEGKIVFLPFPIIGHLYFIQVK